MKYIATKTLILIGFLIFSSTCFGQNNDSLTELQNVKSINQSKTQSNIEEIQTVKSEPTQTVSNGQRRKTLTIEEKIQILESHIEAIDIKVNHINSDKDLKRKASKDSWFEEMQVIREELEIELLALKNELNNE
jgi:hypothetical protein